MTPSPDVLSPARLAAWRCLCALKAGSAGGAESGFSGPGADPAGIDRRERAQAHRLAHGVLRRLALLDHLLEQAGVGGGEGLPRGSEPRGMERRAMFSRRRTPEPLWWILRLAAYEKLFQTQAPDYAVGQQTVALARRAGGAPAARFMNAVVRRLLPALETAY
ncbi:MAG: transcription antitermination protein NusB, partial [bacterium]|nr:transcription antitermination protein NusB [bacterium]